MFLEKILRDIYYCAVKSVDPYKATEKYLDRVIGKFKSKRLKKIIVAGAGKASVDMALAVESELSPYINSGIVIAPSGYTKAELKKIKIYSAGHPLPNTNGLRATKKILNLLTNVDKDTMVVFLLSGGGSSLLVFPVEGITLKDKIRTTELLLLSGAGIAEINTVRKHISDVKGGKLAKFAYPATMVSLIISDVLNDPLDVIASGPTSPDPTTFSDAFKILEKYALLDKLPEGVLRYIKEGMNGLNDETPKKNDKIFKNVKNIIIANNKIALNSAKKCAEDYGFEAKIVTNSLNGEARVAGENLAKIAIEHLNKCGDKQLCLLSSGETTVTVTGKGKGGRNQELALAFARRIAGIKKIHLLSAGTDGIDGNTDAAGAIVDGTTILKAEGAQLDAQKYLANNDSYNFFKKAGGLFITGPTGTNVMDLQIILIKS